MHVVRSGGTINTSLANISIVGKPSTDGPFRINLPHCRKKTVDDRLKEQVKALREKNKNEVNKKPLLRSSPRKPMNLSIFDEEPILSSTRLDSLESSSVTDKKPREKVQSLINAVSFKQTVKPKTSSQADSEVSLPEEQDENAVCQPKTVVSRVYKRKNATSVPSFDQTASLQKTPKKESRKVTYIYIIYMQIDHEKFL